MTDQNSVPEEPAIYRRYRRVGTRVAREEFPRLVDGVVDSGQPVIIEKLGVARAALVPARTLGMYAMFEQLDMNDRGNIRRPLDDLILELGERIEQHLGLEPTVRALHDRRAGQKTEDFSPR